MNQSICKICSNALDNLRPMLSTRCRHHFHQECLIKYLETRPECPACQAHVNNSSLSIYNVPDYNSHSGNTGVQTRNMRRNAPPNSHFGPNESEIRHSTVVNRNDTSPNASATEELRGEISAIREMIERFSQKLNELSLNNEPDWPRQTIHPIQPQPTASVGLNFQNPHYGVPSLQPPALLTNSSKISAILNGWNIRFDGDSSTFPVGKFLFIIQTLTCDNLGGDFQPVCDYFHILLVGRAREWYWRYRAIVPHVTWGPLCRALRMHFADHLSDSDILEMIRDRKQQLGESFESYYTSILQLCDRLRKPLSETEMTEMLVRNLRPQLRKELFYVTISSVDHLRSLVLRREVLLTEQDRSTRQFQKQVKEVECDIDFDSMPSSVQEISKVKEVICWNCRKIGHRFIDCVEERTLFCYGCGAENVVKPNCDNCKGSGNGFASGYRSKK